MKTNRLALTYRTISLSVAALCLAALTLMHGSVSAAACTVPPTSYGTATVLVNTPTAGSYRVWTRVALPTSTPSAYMLEVDGANCFTVSGAQLPIYASNASTHFAANTTNWTGNSSTGQPLIVSLATGQHTLKLVGTSDGVIIDRLILTQDTACIPSGVGTNCATPPDTTQPVITLTAPAAQTVLDTKTAVSAIATDDSAVAKVEFYVDSKLFSTDTTAASGNLFSATLDRTGLTVGNHLLYAVAYDTANNSTSSATVSVSVAPTTPPPTTPTYDKADINTDNAVNYLDLSILASNYGKTGKAISPARADVNGDGTVNYLDLSIVASKYNQSL